MKGKLLVIFARIAHGASQSVAPYRSEKRPMSHLGKNLGKGRFE